jgi:rhodanese-related sulfurtransferase
MPWQIRVMGWVMCGSTRPFLFGLLLNKIDSLFPNAKQITCNDYFQEQENEEEKKQDVVVIDTRPEEEFNVSHMRGAVRLENAAQVNEWLLSQNKNKEETKIVLYCSVGYRSSIVAQQLSQEYGWTKAYNLRGSLFQWISDGHSAVNAQGQDVCYCHPFDEEYGIFLDKKYHHHHHPHPHPQNGEGDRNELPY